MKLFCIVFYYLLLSILIDAHEMVPAVATHLGLSELVNPFIRSGKSPCSYVRTVTDGHRHPGKKETSVCFNNSDYYYNSCLESGETD